MEEIWRDIPGFEGRYQVSNFGNVMSFLKSKKYQNKPHLMKQQIINSGYKIVCLNIRKQRARNYPVHRLVAMAFLDNPNNYPCVNHKDENKLNNHVENLEWCTYQYNNAYGTAKIREFQTKANPVRQLTIDGVWIATYHSPTTAARLINHSLDGILDCCKGKRDFAYGYKWEYVQDSQ